MVQRIEVGWWCGGGNISNGRVGAVLSRQWMRWWELDLEEWKKIQNPRLLAQDGPDGREPSQGPPSSGRD